MLDHPTNRTFQTKFSLACTEQLQSLLDCNFHGTLFTFSKVLIKNPAGQITSPITKQSLDHSRNFSHFLKHKILQRDHKNKLVFCTLNHTNPVHIITIAFLQILSVLVLSTHQTNTQTTPTSDCINSHKYTLLAQQTTMPKGFYCN